MQNVTALYAESGAFAGTLFGRALMLLMTSTQVSQTATSHAACVHLRVLRRMHAAHI